MPEAGGEVEFSILMQINLNRLNLNYQERGSGDTAIFFLHYFGGSSRSWSEVVDGMASTCRCIASDLRGFGASESPASYRVADSANDMEALRAALNIKRFILVGHSMGGKIALEWASRQPSGLQKLLLLAPSPPTPEPMSDSDRENLRRSYGDAKAMSQIIDDITAQTLPPEIFQRTLDDDLNSSQAAWNAWLDVGSRENIAAQMAHINVPVRVLAGSEDEGMNAEMLQREVVARLSDARLEIVPDCGHLVPIEKPQFVMETLRQLLS